MTDGARLSLKVRRDLLRVLLADHPDAPVGAINDATSVPWPASLPAGAHPTPAFVSPFELVDADDVDAMLALWGQALAVGHGRVNVSRALDIVEATIHLVDVREDHGAMIGVLTPRCGEATAGQVEAAEPETPRVCRLIRDRTGAIVELDEASPLMLGRTAAELIGRRSVEFMHPDDVAEGMLKWVTFLAAPEHPQILRSRWVRNDESMIWIELTNRTEASDRTRVITDVVDISEQMAAVAELHEGRELLDRLTQALPVGVVHLTRDRAVRYRNDRLHDILGTGAATTATELLATVHRDEQPLVDAALTDTLELGLDGDLDVAVRAGDVERRCHITMRALTDKDGALNGAVLSVDDVTERTLLHLELERRATFDPLTGSYNRASILSFLERVLQQRGSSGTAVVFIDIDRFKPVNDRYGHAVGDELLKMVADRVQGAIRGSDLVGRIGGDEFILVCPGTDSAEAALVTAERVADLLCWKPQLSIGPRTVRCSVGAAWTDVHGEDAATLVAQADHAMYEAKRTASTRPVPTVR